MTRPNITPECPLNDAQALILTTWAGWLDEQVKAIMACGATHNEAARIHNERLNRLGINDFINQLLREAA